MGNYCLWGAVELFSDKHQRSNVLLCRGAGINWDMGTGPRKFWQIVHNALTEFQSKEANYAHQFKVSWILISFRLSFIWLRPVFILSLQACCRTLNTKLKIKNNRLKQTSSQNALHQFGLSPSFENRRRPCCAILAKLTN